MFAQTLPFTYITNYHHHQGSSQQMFSEQYVAFDKIYSY